MVNIKLTTILIANSSKANCTPANFLPLHKICSRMSCKFYIINYSPKLQIGLDFIYISDLIQPLWPHLLLVPIFLIFSTFSGTVHCILVMTPENLSLITELLLYSLFVTIRWWILSSKVCTFSHLSSKV